MWSLMAPLRLLDRSFTQFKNKEKAMPTVLITGANRGIGAKLAELYAAEGAEVIATARNPASWTTAPVGAVVMPLDVMDTASIQSLKAALAGRAIDILINNAGMFGPRGMAVGSVDHQAWADVFATNVQGPAELSEALLDNLRLAKTRKIATVSSRMGSLAANESGGEMIYRSSKAAVNAVMRCFAHELSADGFCVFNLHPGWVRTDMGGPNAAISVDESAAGLKQVIDQAGPAQNAGFLNYDGTVLPW